MGQHRRNRLNLSFIDDVTKPNHFQHTQQKPDFGYQHYR
jgi:hypothetical protein